MKFIDFNERNVVMGEGQKDYVPIPAHSVQKHITNYKIRAKDNQGLIVCRLKLSWTERLQVLLTGKIWYRRLTFHKPFQPVIIGLKNPFEDKKQKQKKMSKEMIKNRKQLAKQEERRAKLEAKGKD